MTLASLSESVFAAFIYLILRMQFKTWRKKQTQFRQPLLRKEKYSVMEREYVVCNYSDELGKEYIFESEKLPNQINLYEGDMVEVLVDSKNYDNYFVQLEESSVSRRKVHACLE